MADTGLYADPRVYDILHAPGTADEVDGLLRTEARFAPESGVRLWLEPACGSGRYLRVAARRGIDTLGFDQSEAMIAYARKRAERTTGSARQRYFIANMTDFAEKMPRPATFAFNPINTIRHIESDNELWMHLEQMSSVLVSGGVYAVGLSLSMYGYEQPSEDVWEGARGSCRVRQVVQYSPPKAGRWEQVVSHLTVETSAGEEHRSSSYRLRTYSLSEWERAIERSAMRIRDIVDWEGSSEERRELGYVVYVLTSRTATRSAPTG